MNRLHLSIHLFGLILLLVACQPMQRVEITMTPIVIGSSPTLMLEATPTILEITSAPLAYSNTPTAVLVKSITPVTEPSNTIVPTPDEPIVCSPLLHETIATLAEIISDPYNPPPPGRDERHHGVDFSYYHHGDRDTIEGEGIQAILPGTVAVVIEDRLPYGNMVIIETPADLLPDDLVTYLGFNQGESLYHLYAHMQSAPLVDVGDVVQCGQALGKVGMTGYNIINAHLHLETRIGVSGVRFSGMAFYTTSATLEEMDNYQRWRTSGEFRHFDPMTLITWYLDRGRQK